MNQYLISNFLQQENKFIDNYKKKHIVSRLDYSQNTEENKQLISDFIADNSIQFNEQKNRDGKIEYEAVVKVKKNKLLEGNEIVKRFEKMKKMQENQNPRYRSPEKIFNLQILQFSDDKQSNPNLLYNESIENPLSINIFPSNKNSPDIQKQLQLSQSTIHPSQNKLNRSSPQKQEVSQSRRHTQSSEQKKRSKSPNLKNSLPFQKQEVYQFEQIKLPKRVKRKHSQHNQSSISSNIKSCSQQYRKSTPSPIPKSSIQEVQKSYIQEPCKYKNNNDRKSIFQTNRLDTMYSQGLKRDLTSNCSVSSYNKSSMESLQNQKNQQQLQQARNEYIASKQFVEEMNGEVERKFSKLKNNNEILKTPPNKKKFQTPKKSQFGHLQCKIQDQEYSRVESQKQLQNIQNQYINFTEQRKNYYNWDQCYQMIDSSQEKIRENIGISTILNEIDSNKRNQVQDQKTRKKSKANVFISQDKFLDENNEINKGTSPTFGQEMDFIRTMRDRSLTNQSPFCKTSKVLMNNKLDKSCEKDQLNKSRNNQIMQTSQINLKNRHEFLSSQQLVNFFDNLKKSVGNGKYNKFK